MSIPRSWVADGLSCLAAICAGEVGDFALLHRPYAGAGAGGRLEILAGEAEAVDRLAELPLPPLPVEGSDVDTAAPQCHDLVALLPYRLVAERGFACRDDAAPLLAMRVRAQHEVSLTSASRLLPDEKVVLADDRFDLDDHQYAGVVAAVVRDEIGRGEGSNFVIRRTFTATVAGDHLRCALSIFHRLLRRESGAYWTFVVRCAGVTLVGATPEGHLSLRAGTAVMNPISGTYIYPPEGPSAAGLAAFLADRKETEELYMVVDEELKMMGQVCHQGGVLVGPRLRQMAKLAHTEYSIEGESDLDVREMLRRTLFAPTVTGSPVASACRVIARHESTPRGYYGGAVALFGRAGGARVLDSAIVIRTAELTGDGTLSVGAGATLVRHCDPEREARETSAKIASLLDAIGAAPAAGTSSSAAVTPAAVPAQRLWLDPAVRAALSARNDDLAWFWLAKVAQRGRYRGRLSGRRVLVVDGEDLFTEMFAHQVRDLGSSVTVCRFDRLPGTAGYDAVVVGPGPGDPNNLADSRIVHLRDLTDRLLRSGQPMLSVCLGHQVLARVLGLEVRRKPSPAQGLAKEIDFFGSVERVGFYNTFAAYSDQDEHWCGEFGALVEICRDSATGEVHGLSLPAVRSMQFHPESVLTRDGPKIIGGLLESMFADARVPARPGPSRPVARV